MNDRRLRQALEEVRGPDEDRAQQRTWLVVRSAYAARDALPRRPLPVRAAIAVTALAALVAAAFSSPGMAVLDSVRKAIGIARAQPALFSLPAPGRLLVASPAGGAWVVDVDGAKRRLGDYGEASWSPFGRFVAAARGNEVAALEPDGTVRWKLARPRVRFPRWAGSPTDTRIAYLTGSRLHVVAGDGTRDVDAGGLPAAAPVAPAWRAARSARELLLAYADTRGRVYAYAPERGSVLFRTKPGPIPTKLEWSRDGRFLLVLAPRVLRVYDLAGRIATRDDPTDGSRDVDATFLPDTGRVAVVRVHGSQTDVFLLGSGRLLFRTTGELRQVVASPNGRWLLLSWPTADQWVFVRIAGRRRITAVSNIAEQLGGAFPAVAGWCCATGR